MKVAKLQGYTRIQVGIGEKEASADKRRNPASTGREGNEGALAKARRAEEKRKEAVKKLIQSCKKTEPGGEERTHRNDKQTHRGYFLRDPPSAKSNRTGAQEGRT